MRNYYKIIFDTLLLARVTEYMYIILLDRKPTKKKNYYFQFYEITTMDLE